MTVDVTAVCRAYTDLVVRVSDEEIAQFGLAKGRGIGVSPEEIAGMFSSFRARGRILPGGPAANSMAGIAALGGRAAFIGKTGNDDLGHIFAEDYRQRGVHSVPVVSPNGMTACCMIFVHEDGERSMAFNAGVSEQVSTGDIDSNRALLEKTNILYLGHLFRSPACEDACNRARHYAPDARAATLLQMYQNWAGKCAPRVLQADIILGNEQEYAGFIPDTGHEDIQDLSRAHPEKIFARTLGEKGAEVYTEGDRIFVPAAPVARVYDTTGAGDAWAAGFLFGLARGRGLGKSAALGSACAAEILGEDGGRPSKSWAHLAAVLEEGEV